MFQLKKQGAVDVVKAAVELNRDTVDDFKNAVAPVFSAGQPKMVVDLADAPLVDSAGLESLMDLQDQIEKVGGALRLSGVRPLVRDTLVATGIVNRFELLPTTKAAIGSFSR